MALLWRRTYMQNRKLSKTAFPVLANAEPKEVSVPSAVETVRVLLRPLMVADTKSWCLVERVCDCRQNAPTLVWPVCAHILSAFAESTPASKVNNGTWHVHDQPRSLADARPHPLAEDHLRGKP